MSTPAQTYSVRPATFDDVSRIALIYRNARRFMREQGNETQWNRTYPSDEMIAADIEAGNLHAVCDGAEIVGVFALIGGIDPTYCTIDGAWGSSEPYAAIHRVASDGIHHGIFACVAAFSRARFSYLRIDTHEDNIPMQRALDKQGFSFRGIIRLEDGEPRRAYDSMQ